MFTKTLITSTLLAVAYAQYEVSSSSIYASNPISYTTPSASVSTIYSASNPISYSTPPVYSASVPISYITPTTISASNPISYITSSSSASASVSTEDCSEYIPETSSYVKPTGTGGYYPTGTGSLTRVPYPTGTGSGGNGGNGGSGGNGGNGGSGPQPSESAPIPPFAGAASRSTVGGFAAVAAFVVALAL